MFLPPPKDISCDSHGWPCQEFLRVETHQFNAEVQVRVGTVTEFSQIAKSEILHLQIPTNWSEVIIMNKQCKKYVSLGQCRHHYVKSFSSYQAISCKCSRQYYIKY